MKKINKKGIVKLIILIILLITQIKAFKDSRANNITYITANIIDSSGLLSAETSQIIAINEGESGMAITLPDVLNTKKVTKYIVTQKTIIETETIVEQTEDITTEQEQDETTEDITTEQVQDETTEDTTTEQVQDQTTTETTTETIIENVEMLPGEKVYLTQEEMETLEITLTVEYDTKQVGTELFYNKKLSIIDEDDYELLAVSGYMPYDTEIQSKEIDISNIEAEIIEQYPNSFLIGNYDINLISNESEYVPKDYTETLDIEISISDGSKTHLILEVNDNQIQKTTQAQITNGKIKFSVEEINPYLILELNGSTTYEETTNENETTSSNDGTAISIDGSNAKFEIDDFESDKNYYLGLNYTEGMSKTNSGKYTEDNLKEVTINYYGYDYAITEFTEAEIYDVTLSATASRTQTGSLERAGRNYIRTDTITCTVTGISDLQQQYPGFNADSSWTLQMEVPNNNFSNYFSADNTDNSENGVSVSVSDGTIIVTGTDSSALEGDNDTWSFTFYVTFLGSRNNLNSFSFTDLTVNSFETTISIGEYTPYGTVSASELYTLVSYKKCVPTDNSGNVSIELIDNPFMNRPIKRGFNGWKTNNSAYSDSISTNANTFVQTLSTSINNITDDSGNYVINLYPDWIEANVVFASSSGNTANSGTSVGAPVTNDWDAITTILDANVKTATNASNREVNIIVLMEGTLNVSGLTNPSTAYTLTSLYDSTDYRNTSTYLNTGTTSVQLDSDIQLNHIYVTSSRSYTSPGSLTTDGTSAITPCLYGNMYNVRIGRGVNPSNTTYCTWAQVQGGYYNHSSSEFKLVLETGQFYTVQLYRAASGTGATTATTANATIVIGNDIDRINNDNDSAKIYNRMAGKTTSGTASPYSSGKVVNTIIKSGTIGVDYFEAESSDDDSDRNYAGIYVGGHGSTGYDKGDRYLLVEGGNIANIIGGLHMDEADMYKTYMYVKAGNVINITGGAGYTHTYGDRIIQVTGGCVKYSISGGSNGVAASSTTNNGQLTGESLIYVGGTAQIGASSVIDENGAETITITSSDEVLYGVNAGSVCGGANGNSNYAGQTDASYIIIDGQAIVHNNVFGGGNYGVIGAEGTVEGAEIITFNDETANFTANTEYWISTGSSGGYGLSISGTSLANETLSTALIPGETSKWIFESAGGNEYYIKNASTGQYIYISSVSGFFTYTGTVTLSTTDKTAFIVEGTNSLTITYETTVDNRMVESRCNTLFRI